MNAQPAVSKSYNKQTILKELNVLTVYKMLIQMLVWYGVLF